MRPGVSAPSCLSVPGGGGGRGGGRGGGTGARLSVPCDRHGGRGRAWRRTRRTRWGRTRIAFRSTHGAPSAALVPLCAGGGVCGVCDRSPGEERVSPAGPRTETGRACTHRTHMPRSLPTYTCTHTCRHAFTDAGGCEDLGERRPYPRSKVPAHGRGAGLAWPGPAARPGTAHPAAVARIFFSAVQVVAGRLARRVEGVGEARPRPGPAGSGPFFLFPFRRENGRRRARGGRRQTADDRHGDSRAGEPPRATLRGRFVLIVVGGRGVRSRDPRVTPPACCVRGYVSQGPRAQQRRRAGQLTGTGGGGDRHARTHADTRRRTPRVLFVPERLRCVSAGWAGLGLRLGLRWAGPAPNACVWETAPDGARRRCRSGSLSGLGPRLAWPVPATPCLCLCRGPVPGPSACPGAWSEQGPVPWSPWTCDRAQRGLHRRARVLKLGLHTAGESGAAAAPVTGAAPPRV